MAFCRMSHRSDVWKTLYVWIALLLCSFSPLSAELLQEFIFENPPFASCHAPTLVQTQSGKLLCAYFAGSEEGNKDVGIWLSTQSDKGWALPRLIAKDPAVPCWNPVLFSLPSGPLLLFYKVGPHPTSWSGVLCRSTDEGESWSLPEPLPAGVIGPAKNRPLLLQDGTLLCGSSTESWHRWGCWIDITPDEGKSWYKSTPINLKNNLFGIIQPALFFTSEGTLRLLARSYNTNSICTATSEDQGKTWSEATATSLPNPNSAIDAIRLHNGLILLVYNDSSNERTPLNLAFSTDGGLHWQPLLVLEKAPGEYSYPSLLQTKDHWVHVAYTFNRSRIKHVAISPSVFEKAAISQNEIENVKKQEKLIE